MRADIKPGSYFPLFHVDSLTQRLQAPAAVVVTGKLFVVCLFAYFSSSLRCS